MFLLPLLFGLIAIGLILSATAGPWGQVGRVVEVAGFIAVFALALRPVADFLLRPLESRYRVLDIDALLKQSEMSGRPRRIASSFWGRVTGTIGPGIPPLRTFNRPASSVWPRA